MTSRLNNLHSLTASVLTLGRGYIVRHPARAQPEQVLELYEFEACPFCRKVREALSELDLCYVSVPCARGSRHRQQVVDEGGKAQFPYLVDPNTGERLYESEAIIDYLFATYGPAPRGAVRRALAPFTTASAGLASAMRPRGRRVSAGLDAAPRPDQRLVLYNFEASPYCRKVREAAHELDLELEVRNVAKRSTRRPELVARGGKMMVPYLIDPNTGSEMYESDDIVSYLRTTYGPGPGPSA